MQSLPSFIGGSDSFFGVANGFNSDLANNTRNSRK